MTKKLVTFQVTPYEHHIGWAPWKLIPEFPDVMQELIMVGKKPIPVEFFKSKFCPPFNEIKLGAKFLRKIDTLYKKEWFDSSLGEYVSEAEGFLQLFFCDLRDAMWVSFGFETANRNYSKLLQLMDSYREGRPKFPLDEVVVCVGLMLWEQVVRQQLLKKRRTDIKKARRLIQNDGERLNKHYFVRILNELGFGSLQEKYRWRFKKLLSEIQEDIEARLHPYEDMKRETSPVFIFINLKLVDLAGQHFRNNDETFRALAEFYQLFGVPKVKCDSMAVSNYYREWKGRKRELLDIVSSIYCMNLI